MSDRAVEVVAHYPGQEPYTCATINGEHIPSITRTESNVVADGGYITIKVRGTEYPAAGWVAYVAGITETCSPLPA